MHISTGLNIIINNVIEMLVSCKNTKSGFVWVP